MKSTIKKYLGEGLLIVFSVLFALLINKAYLDYRTYQQKQVARESIIQELHRNQAILERWMDKHSEIRDRIGTILNGRADSLKMELQKETYFKLAVITNNEPLMDAILTNTAWETAKTTGIITEFDYQTIQKLTFVYDMQEVLTERTLTKIIDYYFDAGSHDMKQLDAILTQFMLRFVELTGQELVMTDLYTEAIEEIEK